jgi:gas vesicle protein
LGHALLAAGALLAAANAGREARTQALKKLQPMSDLSGSHCAC